MGYILNVIVSKSSGKAEFNPHCRSAKTLRCENARHSKPSYTPQLLLTNSSEKS